MDLDLFIMGKSAGRYQLPYAVSVGKDEFRLEKPRKGGGNGLVVQSKHYRDGGIVATCAVKFLRTLDDQSSDRFGNEVRVLESLDHNHIAAHYGSGTVKLGNHVVRWLAQELGDRNLRETTEFKGPLVTALLPKVACQMCDAVSHLHSKKFIHPDIMPDNFVWVEGKNDEVMMIDFGLAKRTGEDVSARPLDHHFTRTLEFVGPVFYSSPELIEYSKNKKTVVDYRSDIFQLGKTIWFLATGKISAGIPSKSSCPFGGSLRSLIVDMIDDDPSCRPQSLDEVKEAIQKL